MAAPRRLVAQPALLRLDPQWSAARAVTVEPTVQSAFSARSGTEPRADPVGMSAFDDRSHHRHRARCFRRDLRADLAREGTGDRRADDDVVDLVGACEIQEGRAALRDLER